ncbi:MAG TPA: CDP-alcohol phosphatidyltransferase family protein [Gemmatimonadales bacterium]
MTELVSGAISAYHRGTAPLVRALLRSGITPNSITTVGALLIALSAVAYGYGHMHWGGGLLLASGILDTLDGSVARLGQRTTKWGAFYDSTLDRMGDGALFVGLASWMIYARDISLRELSIIACLLGILSSLLVSYMRARAESLGMDGKVGIAQRAERILGLGLTTIVFGSNWHAVPITVVLTILTVLSLVTVVQRFVHVRRQAIAADIT